MKQIVQPQIQHHTSTASSTSSNLPSVSPQCYPHRLSDSGGDDRRNSLICKNLIINLMFISSWYLFATLISLYNKWMFSPEHYDFQYPLFVSSCHMVVQFVLAAITLASFGSIRPTIRPNLKDYSKKAVPCGIASGLDIGLSNTSLKTVTLSFYTMCKSSSLAFVLFFAFLFKLEKPTYKLTGIILLITAGVILMVSSETKFEFLGMVQVLSASCMGGLRWSLTQILLDKRSMGMNTPIATIFWLAPTMAISLGLCSLIFEGWSKLVAEERFFGDLLKGLVTMGYVTAAGVMAFLMTVSEYFLIQRTSVVTLSIAGIFKEVGTILLSTMIFHDVMTPLNISGLGITIFGIGLYNYLKYKQSLESLKESEAILLNDEPDNRSKTNRSTTSPDYEIVSNEIALEERKTFSKRLQSSNIKKNKNISSNEYFDDDERIRGVGSKGYERGGQIVVEIDSDQDMSLKRTESRRYDASEDEGEDLSNDDGDGVGSNDQETKKLIGRVKTSDSLIVFESFFFFFFFFSIPPSYLHYHFLYI
ncbi:triose-phosphate transporter family-domain-containing protein [Phakopsora pachyrhizi]|nr:triose-phosphate transporter family-domain-containing protein [Phakopsora pachyrhizi]